MTASSEFFDHLADRVRDPRLAKVTGVVRFDIVDSGRVEHRLVRIDHGGVTVSTEDVAADCVVTVAVPVLDAIVDRRETAMTALLRGALVADGNPELFVLTQRLFSGSTGSTGETAGPAGGGRDFS